MSALRATVNKNPTEVGTLNPCFQIRDYLEEITMEGPLRGCLAGAAAWKWGGGCLSTIIIFIIVYLLLGHVKC